MAAGAVQGSEANIGGGAFNGQLGAAAAPPGSFTDFDDLSAVTGRGVVPVAAGFHLHRQTGPGVAYANIGEFWQQPGPIGVVLVGPHLPDGVMPVYSVLQPRPGAGRDEVLVDLLPGGGGGAVYNWDYTLQPRPAAGHGEVLVNLLPDGAGHGEVFVGLLQGGVEHGDVLVDLLPDGAGHGEVFVGLLPGGGGGAVHDDYGYYQWQPRPGVGSGDVFIGPLPDGAVYDNRGVVANTCVVSFHSPESAPPPWLSMGSPAVAFHLFVLLLGGLFLVTLHVLRVQAGAAKD
jgi:hypothetical protein